MRAPGGVGQSAPPDTGCPWCIVAPAEADWPHVGTPQGSALPGRGDPARVRRRRRPSLRLDRGRPPRDHAARRAGTRRVPRRRRRLRLGRGAARERAARDRPRATDALARRPRVLGTRRGGGPRRGVLAAAGLSAPGLRPQRGARDLRGDAPRRRRDGSGRPGLLPVEHARARLLARRLLRTGLPLRPGRDRSARTRRLPARAARVALAPARRVLASRQRGRRLGRCRARGPAARAEDRGGSRGRRRSRGA